MLYQRRPQIFLGRIQCQEKGSRATKGGRFVPNILITYGLYATDYFGYWVLHIIITSCRGGE